MIGPGTRLYRFMHGGGARLHQALSRSPRVAERWFSSLAVLRYAPDGSYKQRISNSVAAVRWPALNLRPRRVTLGSSTRVWLRPHPGELDFEALTHRALDYEPEVFQWLEHTLPDYQTVVEVGANVGVFTVFMIALCRQRELAAPRILSFEPSRTAFARLLDNLALNDADAEVFNCALGERSGIASFYEPTGHLTNGSLDPGFARTFSAEVQASRVLVIGADELGVLAGTSGRTLLKIDVEGAEASVLQGLRPWIERCLPDVILEVLPAAERVLRERDYLAALGYRFHRLEPAGPVAVAPYAASPGHRDHLLLAPVRDW